VENKKLTSMQEAAALLLAARASTWAIENAMTKFTPEQQEKIRAAARRRFREQAIAEAGSRDE
jgi:hypothetical protein